MIGTTKIFLSLHQSQLESSKVRHKLESRWSQSRVNESIVKVEISGVKLDSNVIKFMSGSSWESSQSQTSVQEGQVKSLSI